MINNILLFFKKIPVGVYIAGLIIPLIPIIIIIFLASTTPAFQYYNWELQYDQFYYLANARELFENGNGFAHANPFDCRDNSPIIYSHLPTLFIGYLWKLTNLPMPFVYFPLRLIFGMLLTISLWYLAKAFIKNATLSKVTFISLLIGSGISSWIAAFFCLKTGQMNIWAMLKYFKEIEGVATWWFLNIFRNFFYTNEILYHLIFILTLIALAKRYWKISLLLLLSMLYATPFTGLQLGLIYIIYCFASYFINQDRKRDYALFGSAALLLFCAFLFYNIIWLKTFPGHKSVMEQWEHYKFIIPFKEQVLSYGIWFFLGGFAVIRYFKQIIISDKWRIIFITLLVSFLLVNHHYFRLCALQPAHFSRGYMFMALVLFSFYLFEMMINNRPKLEMFFKKPLFIFLFVTFIIFDNVCFLPVEFIYATDSPETTTRAEGDVLRFLKFQDRPLVVATTNEAIGYLTPVFTKHKSMIGHFAVTPYIHAKKR